MKIRTKIMILMLIAIAAAAAVYTIAIFKTQKTALIRGVDQKLETAAMMIKAIVPSDYHDKILDKNSVNKQEYDRIVNLYNNLCLDLNLQYLWSVIKIDNAVYFSTATSPDKKIKNGKHAPFLAIHNDPQAFSAVFSSMKPVISEFYNEWGHGRMILIPFFDKQNRPYCFGASMSIDDVDILLKKTLRYSIYTGLIILIFSIVLTYILAETLSGPIVKIAEFAKQIADKGPKGMVNIGGSREVKSLSDSINNMVCNLRDRERELLLQRKQLEEFIDNAPAVIYMKDPNGAYMLVNAQFEKLVESSRKMILGKTDDDFFLPSVSKQFRKNDMDVLDAGHAIEYEEYLKHKGGIITYISTKFPLTDERGKKIAVCGISMDISSRKKIEERLRLARQAIDTASEAILITDAKASILEVNPAFLRITGYELSEVIGKKPSISKSGHHDREFYNQMWQSLYENGIWEGEIWDRRKNGEIYPKWLSISSIRDPENRITNYVGIFQDISQQKDTEKHLEQLAFFDPLTGLPNRALFHDRLAHEIDVAQRNNSIFALLFIDLDRFKYINDTLGHILGDQLLIDVSQRIKSILRKSDTVARIGGDEFTIILSAPNKGEEIAWVSRKIIKELQESFMLKDNEVFIDSSIGIALFPEDADKMDDLMRCADLAMYQAKEAGGGKYQFFRPEMNEKSAKRLIIETDLRNALNNDELIVYYQPKISTDKGNIIGMEALVRWNHPEKGLISPIDFIPVAEETGLILPLGKKVLEIACKQTHQWRTQGYENLRVAVNLSAKQFQDPKLIEIVSNTLEKTGLTPDGLELEITESVIMENADKTVELIQKLVDMGLHVSIDDFGTGYSSLSYLKRFPLHALKIDRSFIRDLVLDDDDKAIVSAIISLAASLRLDVIAEGVEDEKQLDFLRKHSCSVVQGYYYSKPLEPDAFFEYLKR